MNFSTTKPQILTNDQLARIAPAIFAPHASPKTSARYAFVPTTEVIETLGKQGFYPVRAEQKRVRREDNRGFQTHVLRFRHEDLKEITVGDSLFELVLKTSHDTGSAFDFGAGLYRLVCSNGLCVPQGSFGSFRIKHVGYAADEVRKGLDSMLNALPALRAAQTQMAATALENNERLLLAQSAASLRWGNEVPVRAEQLLTPRRYADQSTDLWSTFNVLQENVIRGGVAAQGSTGRRYHTRKVGGVDANVKLNRELWALADAMGKLKRGETLDLQPMAAETSETNDSQQ